MSPVWCCWCDVTSLWHHYITIEGGLTLPSAVKQPWSSFVVSHLSKDQDWPCLALKISWDQSSLSYLGQGLHKIKNKILSMDMGRFGCLHGNYYFIVIRQKVNLIQSVCKSTPLISPGIDDFSLSVVNNWNAKYCSFGNDGKFFFFFWNIQDNWFCDAFLHLYNEQNTVKGKYDIYLYLLYISEQ